MSDDTASNTGLRVTMARMDERIKNIDKVLEQNTEAISQQTSILAGIQEILKGHDSLMSSLQVEVRATTQAALDRRVSSLEEFRDGLLKEDRKEIKKTRMEQAKTIGSVGGGGALIWLVVQQLVQALSGTPPPPIP